ncbi:unnamed protein product [Trichogramma brassicae]|uniref:Uncharacterized protein n=1 Tax=Trichogramma brassicae TaxID=86971 RepID=A0A6H5IMW3_9HYME|nr:unnamed protein product [Trichogramma brassicae]
MKKHNAHASVEKIYYANIMIFLYNFLHLCIKLTRQCYNLPFMSQKMLDKLIGVYSILGTPMVVVISVRRRSRNTTNFSMREICSCLRADIQRLNKSSTSTPLRDCYAKLTCFNPLAACLSAQRAGGGNSKSLDVFIIGLVKKIRACELCLCICICYVCNARRQSSAERYRAILHVVDVITSRATQASLARAAGAADATIRTARCYFMVTFSPSN